MGVKSMSINDMELFAKKDNGDNELSVVFYPWRRYLARLFDFALYYLIWLTFLAFIFQINVIGRSSPESLLDNIIAVFLMLFIEPLLLHFFKTTPGKSIFGLKIEKYDSKALSYSDGLERTFSVLGTGMGFKIPFYEIVRLWKSYVICKENKVQPWDESFSYTIKDTKFYRIPYFVMACILMFAMLLTIVSAQMIPPNRGDITIEEFVENYNYYARLFGVSFGEHYLNESGNWTEKDFDGTIHVIFGQDQKPQYNFILEDNYVTGVYFNVDINNEDKFLYSYDNQMLLASLSFICAQKEIKLYSKIPNRIEKAIRDNTFNDFNFSEAGVKAECNTEYSGYRNVNSDILLPSENIHNHFKLNFIIHK